MTVQEQTWPEIAARLTEQADRMMDTLEGVKGNVYLWRIGELSAVAAMLAVEEELRRAAGKGGPA